MASVPHAAHFIWLRRQVAERFWQQKRLLAIRIAIWTKPMRWFGAACAWFKHVSHRTSVVWLQLILLLLGITCFEISYFCFKRAYTLSLRRIRLAGHDGLLESLEHDSLQLDGLAPERFRSTIALVISSAARRLVTPAEISATTMVPPLVRPAPLRSEKNIYGTSRARPDSPRHIPDPPTVVQ
jgi:hypothetical protein